MLHLTRALCASLALALPWAIAPSHLTLAGAPGSPSATSPAPTTKQPTEVANRRATPSPEHPLDAYVALDDGSFSWNATKTWTQDGVTIHALRLTSQTWRSPEEVDRPLWQHWVLVAIPAEVKFDTGMLFIEGGRHREAAPEKASNLLVEMAKGSSSIVASVDNIPNQPLKFAGDKQGRVEDDLTSHSWMLSMRDSDPTWIARFPMVKSVVRAMDSVQSFRAGAIKDKSQSGPMLRSFVVAGGSKRGWTAWLTAAVDPRVAATIPIVIDVLDIPTQARHHFAAYGFFSPALADYARNGILLKLGTPELENVLRYDDPIHYLSRVRVPAYIVTATGDEFFPIDSARFYESKLVNEHHFRATPNAGHSLKDTKVAQEVLGFYASVLQERTRPTMTWSLRADGVLDVRSSVAPSRALLWSGDAPTRDFRLPTTGPVWKSSPLDATPGDPTRFEARLTPPEAGFRGYFVELRFEASSPALVATTRAFVVPDVLPYAGAAIPKTPEAAVQAK
ncbi:MAG: PhoPQ-activated protein PqaA family protein [Planctomycetota bacterium]|nr:PhoPQ-activated protein PqaA family protein [Planctomycetota bacterium]